MNFGHDANMGCEAKERQRKTPTPGHGHARGVEARSARTGLNAGVRETVPGSRRPVGRATKAVKRRCASPTARERARESPGARSRRTGVGHQARDPSSDAVTRLNPCRRFVPGLTAGEARPGAEGFRTSFIAVDLRRLLLAGLPSRCPRCVSRPNFVLASETSTAHNPTMANAPRFTIDVAKDVARPGSYRWNVSENMKLRDKSLYSFRTKREAQLDADKFVRGLEDIWQAHR